MYCERYGTGEQIFVGVHGWGNDHHSFAPLAAHVPAHASLYSFDLPGCGRSPSPREWNVETIVGEIVEAVANVGSDDGTRAITLIGNCGGAILSLMAACRASQLIERVVMIDAFAYLPRYFKLFLNENYGRRAYDATFANPVGRWLTNQSLRSHRTGASDLTASFDAVNHETQRRYLALYSEMGALEQFSELRVPVEIVYGEKSFGAVRKSAALWQSVLPNARVSKLVGAGHTPMAEATEQLARIIFSNDEWTDRAVQFQERAQEREQEQESEIRL
jgi:pimeloyl-ACP methyl ester carboxylesterase